MGPRVCCSNIDQYGKDVQGAAPTLFNTAKTFKVN